MITSSNIFNYKVEEMEWDPEVLNDAPVATELVSG